ncbi:MAG: YtxH domain-containing protein [Candidatus Lindowbacteria bacterium]|nr:YtxH domain-containing protein [Candidatus Lindowbacteria bacterium]
MAVEEETVEYTNGGESEILKDGLLIVGGAMIGAAVALLYAPQSGEKTRKKIVRKYDDVKDQVRDSGEDILDKVEDLRVTFGQQIEEGAEYAGEKKEALSDGLSALQDKLDDVKSRFF